MTIIITGGAGFIGSNLVAELSENSKHELVICDFLDSQEKKLNLAKHNVREIINPPDLMAYLEANKKNIEVIFHMGAVSSTVEKNLELITRSNVDLPLALWHWCVKNNVRFLYASSAATYGNGDLGFSDDESIDYLTSLKPLNPYGQSKNQFDIEAKKLALAGIAPPQWAGFKFFNVYGPNEYHKGGQKSVVCQMFKQVKETGKVRLFKSYNTNYADGGQLRDFVYVKDCCNILMWFLNNKNVNGIFNVGSGKARSFYDLALALFSALKIDNPQIEYFEMPVEIRDRYQYFTEASLVKLKNSGYAEPTTSLESGVYDYTTNYLNTKDPYR